MKYTEPASAWLRVRDVVFFLEVEETIAERLVGLTEMVPERVWNVTSRVFSISYWLTRRSMWVVGTSVALLLFPAFIEQQRQEIVAMQDMQTKQVDSLLCTRWAAQSVL